MDWILQNLVQIATVVFVIVSIVRAMRQARETRERHRDETIESDEQRRTREVQEQIRRKIAERRGGSPPAPAAEPLRRIEEAPRHVRPSPEATPLPPGPLGDFGRRVFEQFERKVQNAEPPHLPHSNRGELERQAQLEEQLRILEEAKVVAARRAAHVVQEKTAAAYTDAALRGVARTELLADLRDPHSLRRAFVLREVLGAPVGLR